MNNLFINRTRERAGHCLWGSLTFLSVPISGGMVCHWYVTMAGKTAARICRKHVFCSVLAIFVVFPLRLFCLGGFAFVVVFTF